MEKLARDLVPSALGQGAGDEPGQDQPEAVRRLLIRPGKLIADGQEFLCVVRDVAESGVRVRLFGTLPDHRVLHIEFDSGERCPVRLTGRVDDTATLAFAEGGDAAQVMASQSGHFPRRQPRLHVEVDAILSTSGLRTPVRLRDISQRGLSIDCTGWLMIDELVRIECAVLPTLHAKVRWRRPPRYGMVFEQTFRLDELAAACAVLCPREPQVPD